MSNPVWFDKWLEDNPPTGRGLGTTFKRVVRSLILPSNGNPNVGPVIVLDGTTGIITVRAADNSLIVINPTGPIIEMFRSDATKSGEWTVDGFSIIGPDGSEIRLQADPDPELQFYSIDGTQFAKINQVSTLPAVAILGLNSSPNDPGDGVDRLYTMRLSGVNDNAIMGVIRESGLTNAGGIVNADPSALMMGFDNFGDSVRNTFQFGEFGIQERVHYGANSLVQPVYRTKTGNPTSASTTYTPFAGADIFGVTFVAPASGRVMIRMQGWLGNNGTSGVRTFACPEVREGTVINAGTLVFAANDNDAAIFDGQAPGGAHRYSYVTTDVLIDNCIPGDEYNATWKQRVASTTGSANLRKLFVFPMSFGVDDQT
jgi:hypothetical protein